MKRQVTWASGRYRAEYGSVVGEFTTASKINRWSVPHSWLYLFIGIYVLGLWGVEGELGSGRNHALNRLNLKLNFSSWHVRVDVGLGPFNNLPSETMRKICSLLSHMWLNHFQNKLLNLVTIISNFIEKSKSLVFDQIGGERVQASSIPDIEYRL